jgi:MAF protein
VFATASRRRPIILASASPRRHDLLALSGLDFAVSPVATPEIAQPGEAPADFARRMSRTKAEVAAAHGERGAIVIGADTIVVLDEAPGAAGTIIGKPRDAAQAIETLRRLRGRMHRVLTALTVVDTAAVVELEDLVTAHVPMRAYGDDEIEAYVATGNALDKAGAYAIQYQGFRPVDKERFVDCFAVVMGLPVCRLLRLLEQIGVASRLAQPPADCQRFDARACPIYASFDKDNAG